jgi:hypothetical protein
MMLHPVLRIFHCKSVACGELNHLTSGASFVTLPMCRISKSQNVSKLLTQPMAAVSAIILKRGPFTSVFWKPRPRFLGGNLPERATKSGSAIGHTDADGKTSMSWTGSFSPSTRRWNSSQTRQSFGYGLEKKCTKSSKER